MTVASYDEVLSDATAATAGASSSSRVRASGARLCDLWHALDLFCVSSGALADGALTRPRDRQRRPLNG